MIVYYSRRETIVRVFKLSDNIYIRIHIYIVIPFHDETVCLYIKICNYVLIRNLHNFVEAFYVTGHDFVSCNICSYLRREVDDFMKPRNRLSRDTNKKIIVKAAASITLTITILCLYLNEIFEIKSLEVLTEKMKLSILMSASR